MPSHASFNVTHRKKNPGSLKVNRDVFFSSKSNPLSGSIDARKLFYLLGNFCLSWFFVFDDDILESLHTGTSWNTFSDDDVLFESVETVPVRTNRSRTQHLRGFLEGCR